MKVIPDILYYYNIENPQSTCGKIDQKKRLNAIFNTMKETVNDWKELNIYEKYKFKFIKHILQYTSMVCPEEFKGNYTDKLNMALDINILSDEVLKNVPNETIEIIKMMTNKNI